MSGQCTQPQGPPKPGRTASSASPRNSIFWLCCMPRSTTTSRIFLSCTTLFPWHCGHLSFSLMTWPARPGGCQPQVWGSACHRQPRAHLRLCTLGRPSASAAPSPARSVATGSSHPAPGKSCTGSLRRSCCPSCGANRGRRCLGPACGPASGRWQHTAPWVPGTHPSHLEHTTFLARDSFLVVPENSSSRLTLRGWTTSSPLRFPPRPLPPPIPGGEGTPGSAAPVTSTGGGNTRRTAAAAEGVAAKQVLEDVERIGPETAAATAHAVLERVFSVLVIQLPLFRVAEHLVGGRNLLELGRCGPQPSVRPSRAAGAASPGRTFSGSPPLSGWCFTAAFLYAFFSSSAPTVLSTPSSS